MKSVKVIIMITAMLIVINPFQALSQKKAEKISTLYVITDDNGVKHDFRAPGIKVISGNENLLQTLKIKVPDDVLKEISFYPYSNKIYSYRILNYNNEGIDLEGCGFLNKGGNLIIKVHLNGAGDFFPKGWLNWLL